MKILVGDTGFVGSNIMASGEIDKGFHSSNVEEAYGLNPDILIYAGLRAEKYLANQNPEQDLQSIHIAQHNIKSIHPKQLIFISTIDVYDHPEEVDEDSIIHADKLMPYGANRYRIENWIRENYPDALIIRLPGLFGRNIKKNFIYDMIHKFPHMLKEEKLHELMSMEPELARFYEAQGNGFYRCLGLADDDKQKLKAMFDRTGFSAVHFTDSRSVFQFYPLHRLWNDIQIALQNQLLLWNPATEPICAGDLYQYLTGNRYLKEPSNVPVHYDFHTKHAKLFGKEGAYIMSRHEVCEEIKKFIGEFAHE